MSRVLRIDVHFDFVCPWCLIGKRQLDRALAMLREDQPGQAVEVRWRGVQLLPDAPPQGWPFAEFYRRRLGSDAAVRERQALVLDEAHAAGARVDFGRMRVMPNSAAAHRLYAAARAIGTPARADALLERLFALHFSEGADLGAHAVLLAAAADCGLDPAHLAPLLAGGAWRPEPDALADPLGGVPCFVFDGRLALSGAQPPGRLLAAMRQALETPQPA